MNLLSRVLPPSDNDRGFIGIDGKGKRMQLDVHALSIYDVKLIKTPRISDARAQNRCFYKVDQVYSAAHDSGVNWADPELGIEWPIAAAEAILSEKDRRLPMLDDLAPFSSEGGE
jgi:hypothetical protein